MSDEDVRRWFKAAGRWHRRGEEHRDTTVDNVNGYSPDEPETFEPEHELHRWKLKRLAVLDTIDRAADPVRRRAAQRELAIVEKHLGRLQRFWITTA